MASDAAPTSGIQGPSCVFIMFTSVAAVGAACAGARHEASLLLFETNLPDAAVPPGRIIPKAHHAASHPTSHKQHGDTKLATAQDRPTQRVSQSPDRQLSASARTALTTISLPDALRTTRSTAGCPRARISGVRACRATGTAEQRRRVAPASQSRLTRRGGRLRRDRGRPTPPPTR
jgi:hypothetical protein